MIFIPSQFKYKFKSFFEIFIIKFFYVKYILPYRMGLSVYISIKCSKSMHLQFFFIKYIVQLFLFHKRKEVFNDISHTISN